MDTVPKRLNVFERWVLIFAFQADNLTARFFHVVLIAIPLRNGG